MLVRDLYITVIGIKTYAKLIFFLELYNTTRCKTQGDSSIAVYRTHCVRNINQQLEVFLFYSLSLSLSLSSL